MEIKRQEIGVTEGRAFHEDASEVGVCEDERSGKGRSECLRVALGSAGWSEGADVHC